jgi:hypothetical protein
MGRGRLGDPGPDPNGDGGARNPVAQLSVGPKRVLSFGIGELPAAAAAAKAAGLAAPDDPAAVAREARWQLPPRPFGRSCGDCRPRPAPRGMLGALINDLHTKLTASR